MVFFLQKILCKFSHGVRSNFWPTFWNSSLDFDAIFGIMINLLIFSKLLVLLFFFFMFWYYLLSLFSRNISIRKCTSWLIYFFEHIVCVRWRKFLKILLMVSSDIQVVFYVSAGNGVFGMYFKLTIVSDGVCDIAI